MRVSPPTALSGTASPSPAASEAYRNAQKRAYQQPSPSIDDFINTIGHVWTAPWQEPSDVIAALVGCGHVSGLLMRQERPLALMLCADRVPIERLHLEVR